MSEDWLQTLIRPEVRALQSYHVPESAGLIKLDAMENPFSWPESMRQEWAERIVAVEPNRYPDPQAKALVQQMREVFSISDEQALLLGNGSDELIQMLLVATASPGRKVLSVEPGFVMYRQIARFLGLEYVGVPLAEDFSLNVQAMLDAIASHQPAVIFIAYPNNPSGNLFDSMAIRQIIDLAPGLVVIDEAYEPFAKNSFMEQAGQPENLLVMRTVSKLGLAGLRLGYLVGAPRVIDELEKIRLPYNINVLTQFTVAFALKHYSILLQQVDDICQQRAQLVKSLSMMPGVTAYATDANFVLIRLQSGSADDVFMQLREHGVLIKNLSGQGGLLANCLRVTVGSAEENQTFLEHFEAILRDAKP